MITDAMVEAGARVLAAKYCGDPNGMAIRWNAERQAMEEQGYPVWQDYRDDVRAALSAALPAAWQDIKTAPRDGTEFDAWVQRTPERPLGPVGRVCNVRWLNGSWAYRTTPPGHGWYTGLDGKVTLWMPLPAPPPDRVPDPLDDDGAEVPF